VRSTELLVWSTLWVGIALGGVIVFHELHRYIHRAHPDRSPGDLAMGLMVSAAFVGALCPAMLLSNTFSWLVPAVRRANEAASSDLETMTFHGANRGLILLGLFVAPLAMAQGIVGALEPRTR